ncbi:molecular chaperone TorD [Pseudomonas sp. F1_0610]|uniref:molecular chaperone TorD n=1 Tax=Pseudomonas sp. F1_0610 TaxID=3114284 RepID=UPI0039C291DD
MLNEVERSTLYRLLAGLILQELQGLRFLALKDHWQSLFSNLAIAQESLSPTCQRCLAAIQHLLTSKDAELELRADFTQLFLQDASKTSAAPYASLYQEQPSLGTVNPALMEWFDYTQLKLNEHYHETKDHLAALLELMAHLIEQNDHSAQQAFLNEQVLTWLPKWAQRCQKTNLSSDFYPAVAQLTLDFCKQDQNNMKFRFNGKPSKS